MKQGLTVVAALLLCGVASAAEYEISDLGTLDGTYSDARAVNRLGLVVGAADSQGENSPVLYTSALLEDLGTLGGPGGEAWGINDVGQVVGWAYPSDDGPWSGIRRAFVCQPGSHAGPWNVGRRFRGSL